MSLGAVADVPRAAAALAAENMPALAAVVPSHQRLELDAALLAVTHLCTRAAAAAVLLVPVMAAVYPRAIVSR